MVRPDGAQTADRPSRSNGLVRIGLIVCSIASVLGIALAGRAQGAALARLGETVSSLDEAWSFLGDQQGGELGWAVSAGGNVNGDAWGDVLVGEPKATGDSGSVEGLVYVFMDLSPASRLSLTGPSQRGLRTRKDQDSALP